MIRLENLTKAFDTPAGTVIAADRGLAWLLASPL
jgi:hypothetical protein